MNDKIIGSNTKVNFHSTDGYAEDLIRSFVQVAALEMHAKTLLEKRESELTNGMNEEITVQEQIAFINDMKEQVSIYADMRRSDMLFLYQMFGSKGDKKQWCMVKHLAIASMTAFEAWQGCDDRYETTLFKMYVQKNALFLNAMTKFLGVEITECASCFSDILKGEML